MNQFGEIIIAMLHRKKLADFTPYIFALVLVATVLYLLIKMLFLYQHTVLLKQQEVNESFRSVATKKNLLFHSQKWHIQAEIVSLPVYRRQQNAWYFTIKPIFWLDKHQEKNLPLGFPSKIRVAWYQSFDRKNTTNIIPLKLGDYWRLWLKLKPIHSYANSGSFDYEKWAFVNHIDSRAYILNSTKKQVYHNYRVEKHQSNLIDRWRSYLRTSIDTAEIPKDAKALLMALMIGDKSFLSQGQWDAFRDAGISHLLAISGLHISLVALFMGWLASLFWRRSVSLCRLISAPYIWFFGGLLVATIYSLLSGFDIPVQRALVMLAVTFFSLIVKRYIPNLVILLLAFIAVLLFDIRSFYATGFWLSFVSVAIIIMLIRGNDYERKRLRLSTISTVNPNTLGLVVRKIGQTLYTLFRLQLAITICLIPLLLFFFQTASIISPIANLLITPVVGFVIIPMIMIAVLLSFFPTIFSLLIMVIGLLLTQINSILIASVQWLDLRIQLPSLSIFVTMMTTVLLIILFTNIDWKKRLACLLATVTLLYPYPQTIPIGHAQIHVLDVGQGLSVVVFTTNHSLIYDFGNRGLGRTVVYPFMNANLRKADRTIISHHDVDHYGGAEYVLAKYPNATNINWKNCQGQWKWDKVSFQLWQYPSAIATKKKDNNQSCVVKIISENGESMLLTADIEKEAESWLVNKKADALASDVLLVPHQGSQTSSTRPFIEKVRPKLAIVSAGFENHFKHPHRKIVMRYNEIGVPIYSTICGGTLTIHLGDGSIGKQSIKQYRQDRGGFWLRQCNQSL